MTMAAKDARLKQLMVYRLEEQLRAIVPDDVYSQILTSLSRCVQSLLVPKKEKGHDGSGDATSLNPFTKLDDLLLMNVPRNQDMPAREKLLVLLADSLSVVFSTVDDLKPGPVSRSYLDSVVNEEMAMAEKNQRAQNSSNASNVITNFSGPDTMSGITSSMSQSAVSSTYTAPVHTQAAAPEQQQWNQQQQQQAPAPVQTPAANFGTQPASLPNQQQASFGTAPTQSRMPYQEQQQVSTGGFGGSQPAQTSQSFSSQQSFPSFGTQSRNLAPNALAPQPVEAGISFGTKSKPLVIEPQQQSAPAQQQQSFNQAPAQQEPQQFNQPQAPPQQNFGNQSSGFSNAQPQQQQQQQFQSAPAPQAQPGFGGQQQSFGQQQPVPQQQQPQSAPGFGGQQSSFGQQQQQPAPQQQFQSAPAQAASGFGGQQNFGTQQQQQPVPQQQQFQSAPAPQAQPGFSGQQSSFGQQQQQPVPQQQQFQSTPAPQAQPGFGGQQQSFGNQQQQPAVAQQQPVPSQAGPGFGATSTGVTAPQTQSSQPASTTSSMNVTSSNGSQMTSKDEVDGGSGDMYKLPVKKPIEMPTLASSKPEEEEFELKLYDWKDYNPGPSNFGKHIIPAARGGGGYGGGGDRGGRGGGFSGGRGGGDRGGGRGGGFGGRGGF